MNWLRRIFRKPDPDKYEVVYYPEAQAYYAVVNGRYLKHNWNTGVYERLEPFLWFFAKRHTSEKDAEHTLKRFKEQQDTTLQIRKEIKL